MFVCCPQVSVNSGSLLVSDQPMVEEEGFLPKSWVSTSKEGEATVIGLTDPLSHDPLQPRADLVFDNGDEEEEQQPGRGQSVTTQPDLEDLGLEDLAEDKNESFSNEFEDYGSGNLLLDEYLGSYEGVGGIKISEEQKGVAEKMGPAEANKWPEFQSKVLEERDAPKKESGLKIKNNSEEDVVGEDGKKTWYFWK